MARPRRPYSGLEEIDVASAPYFADLIPGEAGMRQLQRWERSKNFTYRAVNGVYDPMTYMFVLDALMNIDPSLELRAHKMVEWLNEHYKTMVFDSVTVGRVLSDLCDNFEEVLGAKNGLLERGRDWKGHFYVIHRVPEVARVAFRLRDELMKATVAEMNALEAGRPNSRLVSPLNECPSMRGEWKGTE